MNAALPSPTLEPTLYDPNQLEPFERLWRAALSNLVSDAMGHWQNRPHQRNSTPADLQEAFEDLTECGPITQRFSMMCGLDPEYVSAAFIRWCEND